MTPQTPPAPNTGLPLEDGVVLLLQVPRTNDKKELAAEQMFASLHGLLTLPAKELFKPTLRERISFEIAVIDKRIGFYVWVPTYLKDFVEEQIYAQYPNVQISDVTDFSMTPDGHSQTLVTELKFRSGNACQSKLFRASRSTRLPLLRLRWLSSRWTKRPGSKWPCGRHRQLAPQERTLCPPERRYQNRHAGMVSVLWAPPEKTESSRATEYEQVRARGAEEKSHKLAFEIHVRIVYRGNAHPIRPACACNLSSPVTNSSILLI